MGVSISRHDNILYIRLKRPHDVLTVLDYIDRQTELSDGFFNCEIGYDIGVKSISLSLDFHDNHHVSISKLKYRLERRLKDNKKYEPLINNASI